jgi:hypothetical protein
MYILRTFFAILAFFATLTATADTEPNNTWQTAVSLPPDRTVAGTQSDDDWYVINVVDGNRVLVDTTFIHADGDIQIRFFDDSRAALVPQPSFPGNSLASSVSDSDHEFIDRDLSLLGAGTYYINVYGQSQLGNRGSSYTLTWTELAGLDDSFEPNEDLSNAKAIAPSVVAFGSQNAGDEDWYRIEITPGDERVLASLRFGALNSTNSGELDLFLHHADGTELASSEDPLPGVNELIDETVSAGTYYLRVIGADVGDGYALNWAGLSPGSTATFPVPAANTAPQATPSTVSTTVNTPYSFALTDFTYTDAEGDSLISASLRNLSLADGTLSHSDGTAVSEADTLTAAQLATLVYTPPADSVGSPLAMFDFTVNDLLDAGTVAAPMSINVTEAATISDDTPTDDTSTDVTPVDTGGSSGSLAPAWLLLMVLVGLFRKRLR